MRDLRLSPACVHVFDGAGRFLTAFVAGSWRILRPDVIMQNPEAQNYLSNLLAVESESGQTTWKDFLFSVPKVRELDKIITPEAAVGVIQAGLQWSGGGWNSSTASKALFQLTGVPLVSKDFTSYRDAWLYGLAQHWQVEVPECELSPQAAAAACAVTEACGGEGEQ